MNNVVTPSERPAAPSPAGRKQGGFHYAFLIVASGIVLTCVPCALVYSCAGIYFTPVSEYFHVAKATFTLYFSIANIAMMIGLPVSGKLMSKLDIRIVLTTGVIFDGAACIAMSFFHAVWQFYIAGVFIGLGTAPLLYLAVPTLINAWCRKRVGFFVGLCMAFTGIGGVIFNPLGTALIKSGPEGWRTGYLVFGIIILVVTLPFTVFVVRSKPSDKGLLPYGATEDYADAEGAEGTAEAEQVRGVSASKAMRTPAFFALAVFCGIITINQTVYQFLPSYCQSFEASLPQIAALSGVVASACMAGQALGKVLLGTINDKSVVAGLSTGIGGGIIGVVLMWFLPAQAAILMVGAFLFGFVYACTTVQTPLLVRAVFGSRDYTNIYSRVSSVGALAGAFAAVFWGFIVDLPGGFPIMFTLSLGCMVLAFVLGVWSLKQARKIEHLSE
ncbi:MFS transporter [Bifidobacterium margollesii]|uniref:MFS transporter n=1 Tax=Bifidobacterium margollesii TaxID=2020964 RepID=A0A2N5JC24_9BIFI|nr:MFS transporter [Bifidobacterium margollesii]PLS31754.1 MFS transporter [Bifidobacterium margollesii]